MTLTFASGKRDVPHKPITLRNAETLNGWADKLKAYIRMNNKADMTRFFVELTRKHPELSTLLDMSGAWNQDEIQRRVGEYRKMHERATEETGEVVEFDVERYTAKAQLDMKTDLQNMIKDTPVIAKMMHFMVPRFPEDIESLKMGIECIKTCAADGSLDGITDDEWLDVSAAEVADWVTNFCNHLS